MSETITDPNTNLLKQVTPEEKESCPYFELETEIIINSLIQKIISLAITKDESINLEKKIPYFFLETMFRKIKSLNTLNYVVHENDDIPLKLIKDKYYSKSPQKSKKSTAKNKKANTLNKDESKNYIEDSFNFMDESSEIDLNNSYHGYEMEFSLEFLPENTRSLLQYNLLKPEHQLYLKRYSQCCSLLANKETNKLMVAKLAAQIEEDKKNKYRKTESSVEHLYIKNNSPRNNNTITSVFDSIENFEYIKTTKSNKSDKTNVITFVKDIKYDAELIGKNNWNLIPQPARPAIERDAASKILYRPMTREIIEEEHSTTLKSKKSKEEKSEHHTHAHNSATDFNLRKSYFSYKPKKDSKPKKKKAVIVEFPAYDLPEEKYIIHEEGKEMQKLRDDLEVVEKKRKEELKMLREKEKMRELEEQRRLDKMKELSKKNITVDINGEIVFIKEIDKNSLLEEFTKGAASFKDIKKVKPEAEKKNFEGVKVEKNTELDEKKSKMKGKNKANFTTNNKKGENAKKGKPLAKIDSINSINERIEKLTQTAYGSKFAAGSNFDLFKPECGVNLIEDTRYKSGGKDYLSKYNRYSEKNFGDMVSKTAANFFPHKEKASFFDPNVKPKARLSIKRKSNIFIEDNFANRETSKVAGGLHLKTTNLGSALRSLDLMTEEEMRELNGRKMVNKNLIKDKAKPVIRKDSLNEINHFAKAIVTGINANFAKKEGGFEIQKAGRVPKKPEMLDLVRELDANALNRRPRNRLPPINTVTSPRVEEKKFAKTKAGFFRNKVSSPENK